MGTLDKEKANCSWVRNREERKGWKGRGEGREREREIWEEKPKLGRRNGERSKKVEAKMRRIWKCKWESWKMSRMKKDRTIEGRYGRKKTERETGREEREQGVPEVSRGRTGSGSVEAGWGWLSGGGTQRVGQVRRRSLSRVAMPSTSPSDERTCDTTTLLRHSLPLSLPPDCSLLLFILFFFLLGDHHPSACSGLRRALTPSPFSSFSYFYFAYFHPKPPHRHKAF